MSSRNLGQQTGKPLSPGQSAALVNTPECLKLVSLIGTPCARMEQALAARDYTFYCDMYAKVRQYKDGLIVTGRQLFWLRDIKDKLVEKGLI